MKNLAFVIWISSVQLLMAADRVALVVGCGRYRAEGVPELSTPVNDAHAITSVLRRAPLGFEVVEATDATRNQFFEKLDEFKARARNARVVLVYFSGHGIEADGVNYLIPVDAVLEKPSHLESEAVPFARILAILQNTGAEAKVAVLDACRNNPFGHTKSWRDSAKGINDGVLAALGDAQLPEATLVCFATAPGRKAAAVLEDHSQNSPFTEFLVRRLVTPGAPLRDIFEATADDVARATKNRQLPYVKYDGSASVLRQLVLSSATAKVEPVVPEIRGGPIASPSPVANATIRAVPVVPTEPGRTLPKTVPALGGVSRQHPFINTLGMKFVPVADTGVLFSIWETRIADYKVFVAATQRPWSSVTFKQADSHPAMRISWEDATAFCRWLTEREHSSGVLPASVRYRLPTDLEWSRAVGLDTEYGDSPQERDSAAPGFPWGYAWPPPKGCGNYDRSLHTDSFEFTSPVGSFPANNFGIFDLGGNAFEWVEDLFDKTKGDRTVRGASWADEMDTLMSSTRVGFPADVHNKSFGFRCVMAPAR